MVRKRCLQFCILLASFYAVDCSTAVSLNELLDDTQGRAIQYFWSRAHSQSGMALERSSTVDTVTTGGTGFGLMALVCGAERGFISRKSLLARCCRIVQFLERVERFHGVWPHWLHGRTGKTIPFSSRDDGADLVETAFLVQGLLTVRQYFSGDDLAEQGLRKRITDLWRTVEWSFFRQADKGPALYWHWSPRHGFAMNLPIRGWNEALIVYVLAAASPSHPIGVETFHRGWAGELRLEESLRQPLFWAHYSFLGLDPRGLFGQHMNYWNHNVAHTLANHAFCQRHPGRYRQYGRGCWGLTASDTPTGYAAHCPADDRGVISPTAALASFPYAPALSEEALRFFYRFRNGALIGPYGPRDAFEPSSTWVATDYLAIDQGPIVVMIENYRTALCWNLFMSCPEVKTGLDLLGLRRREQ